MAPIWDYEHDRPRNGRCKFHGGMSTGPKTAEGKAAVVASMLAGQARARLRRLGLLPASEATVPAGGAAPEALAAASLAMPATGA